ncbi:hypothetical protein [Anaeromusa acidaminophila]|uniref:hypothetical protein n=1 Tax=Anaeromusa acidaminophila TaxID=81464 RepID=UPI00035EE89B|nr:hypothetical protein [Anaeromusa acidaminophila]
MLSWKRWNVLVLAAFFSVLILVSFSAEYVLFRLNENLDIEQSIEKQIGEGALYGRLLIGQDAIYKMQMAKKQRADILVIGSSRVMQLRREFFSDDMSFFNAGGCMPNIEQGIEFLDGITIEYKPKVIMLGIDLWWLNGAYNEKDNRKKEILSNNMIQNRLFLYGSLFDNVINGNIRRINVNVLRDNFHNAFDPFEHRPAIGLLAALNGDGFRVDGSYQYGGIITGKKSSDKNFEDTHKRIATGTARFEYTETVDAKKLEQLKRFVSVVKSKGIPIVVFAPPFAHVACPPKIEPDFKLEKSMLD